MNRTHAHGLCGPGCRYKPLYEGSQSSLSDMAGKQASALRRVSRLRQGIILELKQAFPVEFADAERQLGRRMSDLDDEVLLAYLAGFLAMPKAQTAVRSTYQSRELESGSSADDVEKLRTELAAAGVTVPVSGDLSGWADAVRTWADGKTPPQVAVVPPPAPGRAPEVTVSDARLEQPRQTLPAPPPGSAVQTPFGVPAPSPTATPATPASAIDSLGPIEPGPGEREVAVTDADAQPGEDPGAWDALFADDAPPPPPEPGGFAAGPGALGLPSTDQIDWATEEVPDEAAAPDVDPWTPPAPEEQEAAGQGPADHDPLSGLFDDEPAAPAPAPVQQAAAPKSGSKSRRSRSNQKQQTAPAVPAADPTPAPAEQAPAAATEPERAPGAQSQLPLEPAAPTMTTTRTSGPIKPVAPGGQPASRPPAKSSRKPAAPKPRGRRPRVSAAGPGSGPDPVEALTTAAAAAGGQITDELRDKFLAVVCMPRPVFISDLVEMVGDADLVAAWETEYRSMGAAGPLRFIAAKQRHKDRGALILPFAEELRTATAGFEQSQWARCIQAPNLKGAKLYELAVLLHRVIDQIVTFEIGKRLVSMRINQQRGLVGVVLVLDPETSAGSEAREEMGEAMVGLAEGRLSLMAVCTYAGGTRSVPDLAQSAREEIDAHDLTPAFPVIAQNSWLFASDGGTSAVSVL